MNFFNKIVFNYFVAQLLLIGLLSFKLKYIVQIYSLNNLFDDLFGLIRRT